jgi:SAM-dependent methyltransferase
MWNGRGRGHLNIVETQAYRTLRSLEQRGLINQQDSFLIVFAGDFDQELFNALGYMNCTFSSMDMSTKLALIEVDATEIPFEANSFDHVFAHAGLHHAIQPHKAICDMYRVARKSVIGFEAQDSFIMRVLAYIGGISTYEWNAIIYSGWERGGADDGLIPNHVYRWNRREAIKLIRSLDPAHKPNILFFREWSLYWERFKVRLNASPLRFLPDGMVHLIFTVMRLCANGMFGSQGNLMAFWIAKGGQGCHSWIEHSSGDSRLAKNTLLQKGLLGGRGQL